MVTKLTEQELKEAIAQGPCVVDFSASWCGPCQMLAPMLEELSDQFGDKIKFYNVDVDENLKAAREYKIMSVPALLLFQDGDIVKRQVGVLPKEELAELFQSLIG